MNPNKINRRLVVLPFILPLKLVFSGSTLHQKQYLVFSFLGDTFLDRKGRNNLKVELGPDTIKIFSA